MHPELRSSIFVARGTDWKEIWDVKNLDPFRKRKLPLRFSSRRCVKRIRNLARQCFGRIRTSATARCCPNALAAGTGRTREKCRFHTPSARVICLRRGACQRYSVISTILAIEPARKPKENSTSSKGITIAPRTVRFGSQ
jgi:hypothetical protein